MFIAVIFTNPITNQYLVQGMETAMYYITFTASYVLVVFLATSIFYGGMEYAKREKLNIPSKKAKTQKAGKFIKY